MAERYSAAVWAVVVTLLCSAAAAQQVPCYFIFGDSLVDNGNNNQLQSLARADYLPYGIDFGGPTGRFSNGKTTVDVIGNLFTSNSRPFINILKLDAFFVERKLIKLKFALNRL